MVAQAFSPARIAVSILLTATCAADPSGLDRARLDALRDSLAALKTRALLIVRRGAIAYEWYAPKYGPETRHGTASLAKALVGGMSLALAIDDGLISPDDLASRFIPAWKSDPLKSKITIRHLATHTSGLSDAGHVESPEWMRDFWARKTPDPFTVALHTAPMLFEPGTRNQYSNPGMAALAYCVTAAIKDTRWKNIHALLKERVMDPIGVPPEEWSIGYGRPHDIDGMTVYANWGGGAYTPRAAARVGQLMMWQGAWNGRQLIRRETVKRSLTYAGMPKPARHPGELAPASGLAWYTNFDGVWPDAPRDAFAGAGAGHEVLIVIPSLDLIVVRNGEAMSDHTKGFWGPVYHNLLRPLVAAVVERGPYPPSPVIGKVTFAPESEIRRDAIDSDNWPITWAGDGEQYTSYGDGWGFDPRTEKKLGMGIARITGAADAWRGVNIRTATGERLGDGAKSPKASGMLMVGGVLYMWVRNTGNAQLVWSKDRGKTWEWGFKFETSFGSPGFLNFGRNYRGARDNFVYTYSQDGPSAYESDNQLILARVPKNKITDRAAYEFFERLDGGRPVWTRELARRGAVFTKPAGCQRLDAVYNPGLKRYLLALGYSHGGGWGIFDAPEPWGPWTTAFHTEDWGLGGTHGYRLPAKWIGPDGRTMTLIFSGVRLPNINYDAFCTRKMVLERARSSTMPP